MFAYAMDCVRCCPAASDADQLRHAAVILLPCRHIGSSLCMRRLSSAFVCSRGASCCLFYLMTIVRIMLFFCPAVPLAVSEGISYKRTGQSYLVPVLSCCHMTKIQLHLRARVTVYGNPVMLLSVHVSP